MKCRLIILAAILAFPAVIFAHAFVDHAEPKVGATVEAPKEIRVWFTLQVDPASSTLTVLNSGGKELEKEDVHTDPENKKLLIVSVPQLPPGEYKVVWNATSAEDKHRTHGDFKFTVEAKK